MIIEYLKKYEKEVIITSIVLMLLSIVLIAKPEIALTTLLTIFGIIFLIDGVMNIISYMLEEVEVRAFSNELIMGILLTTLGAIILFNKAIFISIIPIMMGIWIIIKSIMKFQLAINLRATIAEKWLWILVSSIIMFILGIILIANPFEAIFTITRFIGIILLITETCNLIESTYILLKFR